MANIQLQDIKLAGHELFDDTENYLSDLNDSEVDSVQGGLVLAFPTITITRPIITTTRPTIPWPGHFTRPIITRV